MPLGIRPINDFAFQKTFGSQENEICLISLLNSILTLPVPIVDVTIENPFNLKHFQDDKMSILDIKAKDESGAIYHIEMQLSASAGLVKRMVFYGCELYTDQLREGENYSKLRRVFSICLLNGVLWSDSEQLHNRFRLTDDRSGRVLDETLEIHILELGRYNLSEAELRDATDLECWIYWLLHAHEYETDELLELFPDRAFQQATRTITMIQGKTEEKAMYDSREKAVRDYHWHLEAAHEKGVVEGKAEGEARGEAVGRIQTLQTVLEIPISEDEDLREMSLDQLNELAADLQKNFHQRFPT